MSEQSSADLHFEDLNKLRPFEVYIDASGHYLVTSMAERRNVANCRGGRREAYLICAVLNIAVPPLSHGLIDKLNKLATYLTEQGEYEACDLIDTVVERLTPKTKG